MFKTCNMFTFSHNYYVRIIFEEVVCNCFFIISVRVKELYFPLYQPSSILTISIYYKSHSCTTYPCTQRPLAFILNNNIFYQNNYPGIYFCTVLFIIKSSKRCINFYYPRNHQSKHKTRKNLINFPMTSAFPIVSL